MDKNFPWFTTKGKFSKYRVSWQPNPKLELRLSTIMIGVTTGCISARVKSAGSAAANGLGLSFGLGPHTSIQVRNGPDKMSHWYCYVDKTDVATVRVLVAIR